VAKPEWCRSIKCPNSRSPDQCEINEWILRGWPSSQKNMVVKRNSLRKEYSTLAQEDPKALIQECLEKSFDRR